MVIVTLASATWLAALSGLGESPWWPLAGLVLVLCAAGYLWGISVVGVAVVGATAAASLSLIAAHSREMNPISVAAAKVEVVVGEAVITESARSSEFGGWWARARLSALSSTGDVMMSGSGARPTRGTHIVGSFQLRASERPGSVAVGRVIGEPAIRGPTRWSDRFHTRWREQIAQLPGPWSSDERSLLAGLTIGADHDLSDAGVEAMRSAGLGHLTAVSGSNCGVILLGSVWLLGPLVPSRRARLVIGWLALAGFVTVVGGQPSVLRAALMWTVVTVAWLVGARRAIWHALSVTVMFLLLIDPWLAQSLGFALSVAATAGLAALWKDRAPVMSLIRATVAAQAATAPLLLALGLPLGVMTVLANVIVAPFVALITVTGMVVTAVAGLGVAHPALSAVPLAPVRVMLLLALWAQDDGPGSMSWLTGTVGGVLAAVLILAVFVVGLPTRLLVVCAIGVAVVATGVADRADGWPPPNWAVVACDVGQGDSFVVRGGDTVIVVDAGPEPEAVDRCLGRLGVRRVDLLVLSHFHADHVEGLPGVLRRRVVSSALVPVLQDPPEQAAQVIAALADADVPSLSPQVGDTFRLPGATVQVLWPARVIRSGSEPNNASICVRVVTDTSTTILLGDVETEAQRAILSLWPDLRSDIVKVPHHGSAKFVAELPPAVQARIALVGVGRGNSFGHPDPAAVAAWDDSGAAVYATADNGDVVVTTDGSVNSTR